MRQIERMYKREKHTNKREKITYVVGRNMKSKNIRKVKGKVKHVDPRMKKDKGKKSKKDNKKGGFKSKSGRKK